MTTQVLTETDSRTRAEKMLQKIREDCHRWKVSDEIKELRDYLGQTGLSLKDIGSSEGELQACFKEGHRSSARSWLKVAREECDYQKVKTAINHVRERLSEAGLSLDDIGTSEKELNMLLTACLPPKAWWKRIFSRSAASAVNLK